MSNSPNVERKLAAIMFTDIVGYTELSSNDEEKAYNLIKKKRELLQPLIENHSGKLIKEIGDGTLTRYFNTNDAIDCANNFQSQTDEELKVRAGIHSGEVIIDNEDVFGDVVNIASRLESIAQPKSVLVSKETIDKLENKEGLEFVSLGLQSLKGVGRLIEVYALKSDNLHTPDPNDYKENKIEAHSDDEVPSIAIIPFKNKGAEEDVFYAYGISADLITDCSSAGLIRVATLASIEKIKNYDEINTGDLASKLLVRYIAEGTLWKMGNMFQLSIELYDTKDDKVVWSDRWQEKWDNLPTIKGNLSDGLLKALDTKPKVEKQLDTTNTEAYELYLKAKHKYEKRENTSDTEIARGLLNKAIDLDGSLIVAKILLGTTYREMGDYDKAMRIYTPTLSQSEKLIDKYGAGNCLNSIGAVYQYKTEYDKALDFFNRSFEIFEELDDKLGIGKCYNNIGAVYLHKGNFDDALDYLERSLEIFEELEDKHVIGSGLNNIGVIYLNKRNLDAALDYFGRSLSIRKEIGDKNGMGQVLRDIGSVYSDKENYNEALDYFKRSLSIADETGDKIEMQESLASIGNLFQNKGDLVTALDYYKKSFVVAEEISDKFGEGISKLRIGNMYAIQDDLDTALDYLNKSLEIFEELDNKRWMNSSLNKIGQVYYYKGEFDKALDYLEKILSDKKQIGLGPNELLEISTFIYLNYKHISKHYEIKEIHSLIKDVKMIQYDLNLHLYELLEDNSYLEKAYNQIQDKANAMQDEIKDKFLGYPIPKQIIEEYTKVI